LVSEQTECHRWDRYFYECGCAPAGKDEIALVVNLWAVGGENASRPDDSAEAVEALLGRDPEALILAEVDGALAGSVISRLGRMALSPLSPCCAP
jgi:hypothetical protein